MDLLIVGAGPAGLAAAQALGDAGLDAVLLDEQSEPGGQIYRSIRTVMRERPADLSFLGLDYARGAALADGASMVDYRPGSTVWQISERGRGGVREVIYSQNGRATRISAKNVLLATGAMERPVPIPGWTLPGVTTVGALQILLKSSRLYHSGRVVLVGSGPLMLQFCAQCVAANLPIAAIVDTGPTDTLNRAIQVPHGLVLGAEYVAKGLELRKRVANSGIPIYAGANNPRVLGDDQASGVAFDINGIPYELEADLVALHEGVIANTQMTRLVGADHRWNDRQRCFEPVLSPAGETSAAGVFVAGDGGGILGARAAARTGRITGLSIAEKVGRIGEAERDIKAELDRFLLIADKAARSLLDNLFPPPNWLRAPADEVVVCRCEAVSAGQIRAAVADGSTGPNQTKAWLRCGMGPCQGRMCANTVTEIISAAREEDPGEVGQYRVRPPAKPVTLSEIAALDGDD